MRKHLVYLISNLTSNAPFNTEVKSRIGKGSGTFACLSAKVLDNKKLNIRTEAMFLCCLLCFIVPVYAILCNT